MAKDPMLLDTNTERQPILLISHLAFQIARQNKFIHLDNSANPNRRSDLRLIDTRKSDSICWTEGFMEVQGCNWN